ncbi:preprotein translocase subunit SecY [Patescibacteria group bacterium]
MLKKVLSIFTVKQIRRRILFTIAMLVVFRLMAAIPMPGVDAAGLAAVFDGNQLFGLLNLFTGGGLATLSIAMLGVGPYITSSIIMQLLTSVIPRLEELQKEEGQYGRAKINRWTRYLSIPLGVVQAYGTLVLIRSQGGEIFTDFSIATLIVTIVIAVGGSVLLMWIGEMISEKGIGNGVSLIIFAGILAGAPSSVQTFFTNYDPSQLGTIIGFLIIGLAVIMGVIFITEGQRNVPISYARHHKGNRLFGKIATHLPLRVNQGGVLPIIFAISILLLPGVVAGFFVNSDITWLAASAQFIVEIAQNPVVYSLTYFVLVMAFTYFYTALMFDAKNVAENVQKSGGFVPGIRPGEPTANYLRYVVNRITFAGAIFLGVIAILPFLMQTSSSVASFTIGGTSLLIVVSVALETMKQIEAQMITRDYETF